MGPTAEATPTISNCRYGRCGSFLLSGSGLRVGLNRLIWMQARRPVLYPFSSNVVRQRRPLPACWSRHGCKRKTLPKATAASLPFLRRTFPKRCLTPWNNRMRTRKLLPGYGRSTPSAPSRALRGPHWQLSWRRVPGLVLNRISRCGNAVVHTPKSRRAATWRSREAVCGR